jgi:hypothetical protein
MNRDHCINQLFPIVAAILAAALLVATTKDLPQKVQAVIESTDTFRKQAPMAASGNNVYIAWWDNKTGNEEVMFKASTDRGKTFSDKTNLSNSPKSDSQDVQIAALGISVYVTWWERNATSNEPVLRLSHDSGKTFGEKIILSAK